MPQATRYIYFQLSHRETFELDARCSTLARFVNSRTTCGSKLSRDLINLSAITIETKDARTEELNTKYQRSVDLHTKIAFYLETDRELQVGATALLQSIGRLK